MKKSDIERLKNSKNTTFGERIAIIRAEFCGGDTEKLAQLLNTHYSNICKYIDGSRTPTPQQIERLKVALPNLSAEWLITGQGHWEQSINITTNNGNVAGINNGTQTCAEAGVVAKLSDTIATQQRTIEQQNAHIATLLSLLAKQQ